MGKRGPKPKPTALQILDGNPSRRPLNDAEPQCEVGPTKPPTVSVDQIASDEWDRLREVCPPMLYNAMDVSALTQYCLAWSMLLRSQQDIDTHGLMFREPLYDRDGKHVGDRAEINPAVRTWKAANETLFKTTDRLGLSPTARTRIQMPTRKEVATKFDGLLGRK